MDRIIFLLLLPTIHLFSQSICVFDACYFSRDGKNPLLEVGKGFNVTDVYKPTKHCFSNTSLLKLKRTQPGTKTVIDYYYTKTDREYNTLKNQGVSGQVSYLNLFSLGSSYLSSYSNFDIASVERIVFIVKVDFGLFTLPTDPILKPEAKNLITKEKYNDFVDLYGTHYINGVKKESSIWVTLTKNSRQQKEISSFSSSFDFAVASPSGLSLKSGTIDENQLEEQLSKEDYEVSIEINGPPLGKEDLEESVRRALKDSADKFSSIMTIIRGAAKRISEPSFAMITQYYYAPFTLHGLNVINWDDRKQSQLIKINESLIKISSSKAIVDKLTSAEGEDFIESKFETDVDNFNDKEQFKNQYMNTYKTILPSFSALQMEMDTTIRYLGKIYRNCSDIYCNLDSSCGNTGQYAEKISYITANFNKEILKLSKIEKEASKAAFMAKPECEKEQIGYLTVNNLSINPYDFYKDDKFLEKIPGKESRKYKCGLGTTSFKAVQNSGYLMYPTINNRKVEVEKSCEEITIKIGFED
jgi:hypothetical protein